jgi:hypothetical protein
MVAEDTAVPQERSAGFERIGDFLFSDCLLAYEFAIGEDGAPGKVSPSPDLWLLRGRRVP